MASSRAEPTAVTHRVAALLVLLPESGTATEKPACGRPQRHPDGAEGAAGGSAAGLPSGSAGGEEGLELGTARRRTPAGGTAEMETRFLGARGQRWATRTRTCRCSGW